MSHKMVVRKVDCPNKYYANNSGSCFSREMDGSWWCNLCNGTGQVDREVPETPHTSDCYCNDCLELIEKQMNTSSADRAAGDQYVVLGLIKEIRRIRAQP